MDCCQANYDAVFSEKRTKKDLKRYRRKGPDKTTRLLIDALRSAGVQGKTLLDIGGGIGAIDHELLDAGVARATHVDASAGATNAAREESTRRGTQERIDFQHGDFVALAARIGPADVVTLDRVICCYASMEQLVSASASHARELYGIVIPRQRRITRVMQAGINLLCRITREQFRFHVHSPERIEGEIANAGLRLQSARDTLIWRVAVYVRA
ncbi:MAG TPA: methyltransferase domain-containing protein [Gemmatimonadaceae bacterium]|nr:methyltransferase domain-containing protein [Gemmatimonadaceae bacterium]